MATNPKSLLPGFGSQYVSETFTSTAVGADTIDCSRCSSLAILCNIPAGAPTGTFAIEQTFNNGSNWAPLVANASVQDGGVTLLGPTNGPFGVIRINPGNVGSISASNTVKVTITGWERQRES